MSSRGVGVLRACASACVVTCAAVVLAGCSSDRPRTSAEYCARYGCPDRMAGEPMRLTPASYRPTTIVKRETVGTRVTRVRTPTKIAAKSPPPAATKAAIRVESKVEPHTTSEAKSSPPPVVESAGRNGTEGRAPAQSDAAVAAVAPSAPAEAADPVVKKAQDLVAAKMGDQPAAKFFDVRRVSKKTVVGTTIDSVCGRVRGQRASDGKAGEWPFVYIVDEDKAYIVGDNPDTMAGISYRNLCSAPRPKRVGEISAT